MDACLPSLPWWSQVRKGCARARRRRAQKSFTAFHRRLPSFCLGVPFHIDRIVSAGRVFARRQYRYHGALQAQTRRRADGHDRRVGEIAVAVQGTRLGRGGGDGRSCELRRRQSILMILRTHHTFSLSCGHRTPPRCPRRGSPRRTRLAGVGE